MSAGWLVKLGKTTDSEMQMLAVEGKQERDRPLEQMV